ncbi:MAG: tetratricopeptide repeat protein, partial [Myxococcota bacterium]
EEGRRPRTEPPSPVRVHRQDSGGGMARAGLAIGCIGAVLHGGLAWAHDGAPTSDGPRVHVDRGRPIRLRDLEREQRRPAPELEALAGHRPTRSQAIARLGHLLSVRPMGDVRAEMMLRLAELLYEEAQLADPATSRKQLQRVVTLGRAVFARHGDYSRLDQLTYLVSRAQFQLGEHRDAVNGFVTLVRTYPSSPWVPDAYVMLGEYFLHHAAAPYKALKAFRRAAEHGDAPLRRYARYKLAWCFHAVDDHDRAIETMTQLRRDASVGRWLDDAERSLVRFHLAAGQPEVADGYRRAWWSRVEDAEVYEAFASEHEGLAPVHWTAEALDRAARRYESVGRLGDAVRVRQRLVEHPAYRGLTALHTEQVARLGLLFERTADFATAVLYYEAFWDRYRAIPIDALAPLAQRTVVSAAALRAAHGDAEGALANYAAFATRWPEGDGLVSVRLAQGKVLAALGRLDERDALYAATVAGLGEPRPIERAAVAEMRARLAEAAFEDFVEVPVRTETTTSVREREPSLQRTLRAKVRARRSVDEAIREVLKLGLPRFQVEALVLRGRTHEEMLGAMRGALAAAPFLEASRRVTWRDAARLLVQEASAAYRLALVLAFEHQIYDEHTAFAMRRASTLRPDLHPGVAERLVEPRWQADGARQYPRHRDVALDLRP